MKQMFVAALLTAALSGPAALAQTASPSPPASATPSLMMVQLHVADMARSERFYHDVFGMSVTHAVSPREHVLRFTAATDGAPGIMLLLAGSAPHANGGFLLLVPDIDATFARVVAAGGAIVRNPQIGAASATVRSGAITDPDGAAIEVMQYIKR